MIIFFYSLRSFFSLSWHSNNTAGYAAVAKRGVQELDCEPSPTSAAVQSSSFERSDCAHGGAGSNPGTKKLTAIKITPSTEHENNVSLALPGVPGRGLSPTSQVVNSVSVAAKDPLNFKGTPGSGTETPIAVPSYVTPVPPTSKTVNGKINYFVVFLRLF